MHISLGGRCQARFSSKTYLSQIQTCSKFSRSVIAASVHGARGDTGVYARFLRICDFSTEATNRMDSV